METRQITISPDTDSNVTVKNLEDKIKELQILNDEFKKNERKLRKRISVLNGEIADCEKDLAETENEKGLLRQQLLTLGNHAESLQTDNSKLLSYYHSIANGSNLSRRISFLAPRMKLPDIEDKLDLKVAKTR